MAVHTKTASAILLTVTIVLAVLCLAPNAHADGKFFPERAYKLAPAIPQQRAILSYRDGVETLIIESSLDGEGQQFGWIIPLPAKPTKFEKATPGLIKTLSLVLQPKVTHDLTEELNPLTSLAVVLTAAYLLTLLKTPRTRDRWVILILLLLLVVLAGFLAMPALSRAGVSAFKAGHGADTGVRVADAQRIGSYDLAVLDADTPDALDKWLTDNNFTGLDNTDRAIVADYIAENWCFVAARLTRNGDGFSRPHPLAMTFPADKPIYPMRLTATAGSDLYLELFVIADKTAESPLLTMEVCDRYRHHRETRNPESDERPRDDEQARIIYGENYRRIEHPDAAKQIWHGCVMTKLAGTLTPLQMQQDITLDMADFKPARKHYYSKQGARHRGLVWALLAWCIIPLGATTLNYSRLLRPGGRKFYFIRLLLPCLLLSVLLGAFAYASAEKTQVRTRSRIAQILTGSARRSMSTPLAVALEYNKFQGMTHEQVTELLTEFLSVRNIINPYTGERMTVEDSPGNIDVLTDARGLVLRVYHSRNGSWSDLTEDGTDDDNYTTKYLAWADGVMNTLLDPSEEPSRQFWAGIISKADASVMRVPGAVVTRPSTLDPLMIALFKHHSHTAAVRILAKLNETLESHGIDKSYGSAHVFSVMLGCITRVQPPLDVADNEKMNAFLEEVRKWCEGNAAIDSPAPVIDSGQASPL